MDHNCDPADPLGFGTPHVLHAGRADPYPASGRDRPGRHPTVTGPQRHVNRF